MYFDWRKYNVHFTYVKNVHCVYYAIQVCSLFFLFNLLVKFFMFNSILKKEKKILICCSQHDFLMWKKKVNIKHTKFLLHFKMFIFTNKMYDFCIALLNKAEFNLIHFCCKR